MQKVMIVINNDNKALLLLDLYLCSVCRSIMFSQAKRTGSCSGCCSDSFSLLDLYLEQEEIRPFGFELNKTHKKAGQNSAKQKLEIKID